MAFPFPAFRPIACLHEGDHGEVWRVEDADGQPHVLKFLTTDDPAIHAGLLHEARLHGMVRHGAVARLHEVVDNDADQVGLLMEWIDGPCLADRLADGPIPLGEALRIFEAVVRGVRAMHARGVVHRDLKPENIVLRPSEGGDRPVLLDFGLAKRLPMDGVSRTEQGMSQWFTTLGTPEYMAPEQAQDPGEVDERADVFSLGCLLYELLTGHVAFDAEDPDEAMAATAAGRFVAVEDLVAVPERLSTLVRDLLAVDREKRPPHCTAILRRLDGSHG